MVLLSFLLVLVLVLLLLLLFLPLWTEAIAGRVHGGNDCNHFSGSARFVAVV